jgi:hypothetical protein
MSRSAVCAPSHPIGETTRISAPSWTKLIALPELSFRRSSHLIEEKLRQARLGGPIPPYAQGYDAFCSSPAPLMESTPMTRAASAPSYRRPTWRGSSGQTTSSDHRGLAASQLAVAPLDSLSNGLYVAPASPTLHTHSHDTDSISGIATCWTLGNQSPESSRETGPANAH